MMSFRIFSVLFLVILAGVFTGGCKKSSDPASEALEAEPADEIDFVNDVRPILETQCVRCHNDESLFGGLNLMTRAAAMKGSENGPILVPGHPDKSLLYAATGLEHGKDPKAMPATGPKLNDVEKELIRKWIEQGAEWPEGKDGNMAPLKIEPDKV